LTKDVSHNRGLCFLRSSYISSSLSKHCPDMIIEAHYDDVLGEFIENSSQEGGILLYVDCTSTITDWSKTRNLHICMMMGRRRNITIILDHLTQHVPTHLLAQIDLLFVLPFTDCERAVLVREMVGMEYTNMEIVKMAKSNVSHVLLFNLYKVAHEKTIVEFYRIDQ